VNQDVTPMCTVCDHIAPVIESYLSLEKIKHAREYTDMLSEITKFENRGEWTKMIQASLDAISIYKDNDVAFQKLRIALKSELDDRMVKSLSNLINSALKKQDYMYADVILNLWSKLGVPKEKMSSFKYDVSKHKKYKEHIDKVMSDILDSILKLEYQKAIELVDIELNAYPSEKLLKERKEQLQHFVIQLDALKKKIKSEGERVWPRPQGAPSTDENKNIGGRRKIPHVKRNRNLNLNDNSNE
jgi:hypothetical protein